MFVSRFPPRVTISRETYWIEELKRFHSPEVQSSRTKEIISELALKSDDHTRIMGSAPIAKKPWEFGRLCLHLDGPARVGRQANAFAG